MNIKSLFQIQEYLKEAHDDAEMRHDKNYEYYDFEVMQETERLMKEIDDEIDTLQSKDEGY